jgi:hypothetical protein
VRRSPTPAVGRATKLCKVAPEMLRCDESRAGYISDEVSQTTHNVLNSFQRSAKQVDWMIGSVAARDGREQPD